MQTGAGLSFVVTLFIVDQAVPKAADLQSLDFETLA
jgi:hypothetical protein